MSFLVIQGIPLSDATRTAFRNLGGVITRLERTETTLSNWMPDYEFVINMGRSSFNPDIYLSNATPLWNRGDTIKPLIYPGLTRELLGELLPPEPRIYPCLAWLKAPGRGGRGKEKVELQSLREVPDAWDIQVHIEGDHYRLITVGHRVVQNHVKVDLPTSDTVKLGQRTYRWKSMAEVPRVVKNTARAAARLLADEHTIIGWDIVHDTVNDAYILEGNSAPGLNDATAERIINQVKLDLENNYAS